LPSARSSAARSFIAARSSALKPLDSALDSALDLALDFALVVGILGIPSGSGSPFRRPSTEA
jgi:hypothetical protein